MDRPRTLEFENVDPTGATKALVSLNMNLGTGRKLNYKINGGESVSFTSPDFGNADVNTNGLLRSVSIEVPVEKLVAGTNTIEFTVPDFAPFDMIGNVDLSLVVP
jgi:hypothetical protein